MTNPSFFQKEGGQSFFGGEDTFFTKSEGHQNNNIVVQKKCDSCEEEDKVQKKEGLSVQRKAGDADATPPPAAEPAKAATASAAPAFHFIAEDNMMPEPGQMAKTAFMERLKTEIYETVNSALAGTPFSADNCPYIRASFAKHENSSPAQIEALIIRYCPAAAKASSAEDVIRQMKMQVYSAALQWAKSGGDLSAAEQMIGGIAGDIGNAVSSVASGINNAAGSMASGISNLLFKENAGGAATSQSPQAVMQSLGKGSSMDSGTKNKMEGAFDSNFSNVEIHTDSNAAQLSKDMNARAFAVGNHIAFAGGEYQPGTLMGDALMAHELAHTIQQSDGKVAGAQAKGTGYSALEEDADSTAVNVMSRLTGRKDGEFKGKVDKGLKTGLTISRCGSRNPPGKQDAATVKNAGIFEQYRDKQSDLITYLRSVPPKSLSNPDNVVLLGNLYTDLNSNDYWYAKTILENGNEPLWSTDLITERNKRGISGFNGNATTLAVSKGGRPIEAYFFPGKTDNRALIISGVHGSELSGIDVVRILIERLKQPGFTPYYSVMIVPRLFPDNAATAENRTNKKEDPDNDGNIGRVTPGQKDPQRQNPDLGKAYDPSTKKDKTGKDIEPENIVLMELIERFKPARIASVHGKHLSVKGQSGIYADPRTDSAGTALGTDSDKRLAVAMADKAAAGGARVPGNKLDGTKNAKYPQDKDFADVGNPQERVDKDGYSLGGWGSTAVCDIKRPEANRPAMRIITIEVMGDSVEDVAPKADQAKRQAELAAHADALQEIFLGNNEVEAPEDPCKIVPPATKPAADQVKVHIVTDTDTLGKIAKDNGTTVKKIQELNNMGSSTVIKKGQKLILP